MEQAAETTNKQARRDVLDFVDKLQGDLRAAIGIVHCAGTAAAEADQLEINLALYAARERMDVALSDVLEFWDAERASRQAARVGSAT